MDAIAVLILEHDAVARALVGRCERAAAQTPAEINAACDVAFCSRADLLGELTAAAAGLPKVALGVNFPEGTAPHFLSQALHDAVALARAQAALTASLDELEQQRSAMLQLSTLKSDLIATLAHDIKGPLTSIIGFAELLEEGFMEGADAIDAARTIRTNAQRLASLANDILALSRVEHGELEIADDRVNLRDVLTESVKEANAERPVEVEIEPAAPFVRGDALRLRQVFDNVLRNAIKYSPGGEPVRLAVSTAGPNIVVSVADKGIGIPVEDMPKLFQRFGRASNARKSKIAGTGVGLFIVKTIVERHGGTVEVESALGKGSTFTISLPAMESAGAHTPARVVVITGDAQLRRFTAYELRSRGFRVLELESLEAANGKLHEGDVVLVDADLGSGVRARAMLSAAQKLIGLGASSANGWDATLGKPFLVSDLLAVLQSRALAPQ